MAVPQKKSGIYYQGDVEGQLPNYPAWRYHTYFEPQIVNNEEEDNRLAEQGYCPAHHLESFRPMPWRNFGYDFEELSKRQLLLFAKDKYDMDLWQGISKQKLMQILWNFFKKEPEMTDRMILLAQSAEMDYDQTLIDIKDAVKDVPFELVEEFEV